MFILDTELRWMGWMLTDGKWRDYWDMGLGLSIEHAFNVDVERIVVEAASN